MTTAESPTPKPRSRMPLGLLGMLALIVPIEAYIATRNIDLGTMEAIEWRLTDKMNRKQSPRAEILCFGTSLSRIGISPLILEERTGHPTYNLALSGSQPYGSLLMLRHALDAGAKPKAIVVEFKWTAIANDPEGLERILPEVASIPEWARMAWDLRNASFLGRVALVAELPSFRCRAEIRKNIVAAVKGEEPVRNHQWLTAYRNSRVNKGAHHTPKVPYKGEFPEDDDKNFFRPAWQCHPVNEKHIHEFLSLAELRGIPVFLIIPPVSPGVQAKLDAVGVTPRYTAFLEGLLARYRGMTAFDARRSNYPVESFYDATHLNRVGTADLSNALADLLKARLDGPDLAPAERWVALRPYAGGQGQEKLEDFMNSYEHIVAAQKAKDEAGRVAEDARPAVRR
jgi:hypothetical protein